MKQLQKILLSLFMGMSIAGTAFAQMPETNAADRIVIFRFLPGEDKFILKNNEGELERLFALVDECRMQIASGQTPVNVDGYCASLPTVKENLNMAWMRANRVKSELITHKGLKETNFVTANYARAYHNNKDVVVVTLRIPAKTQQQPHPTSHDVAEKRAPETYVGKEPEMQPEPEVQPETEKKTEPVIVYETDGDSTTELPPSKPYCFSVRTNVLYDALLLPTLGVEWRVSSDLGIKLDGSFSCWGGEHGKIQKVWLLNPEVRWYLLRDKRFYLGASGNYGEYNVYKYPAGSLLSEDTGYQGTMWSAGVTVGYQLCLSRHFSVDFNLGLGYTRSEYDRFGLIDGVRVSKGRDQSKSFWGPMQAGINLVWTVGGTK